MRNVYKHKLNHFSPCPIHHEYSIWQMRITAVVEEFESQISGMTLWPHVSVMLSFQGAASMSVRRPKSGTSLYKNDACNFMHTAGHSQSSVPGSQAPQ